jgi:hypothetical protein
VPCRERETTWSGFCVSRSPFLEIMATCLNDIHRSSADRLLEEAARVAASGTVAPDAGSLVGYLGKNGLARDGPRTQSFKNQRLRLTE